MSILDSVLNAAEKHSDLNQQQHLNLVQTAVQMFSGHSGLSNLQSNADSQGIGHIFQSWVGNGQNQPIAPDQVQGLIGENQMNQLAARIGVPPAIAGAALARVLPVVVDKLTPGGNVPQAA